MKKIYLKIISIIVSLLLGISISFQNNFCILCKAEVNNSNELRLQDDFYEAVNYEWINKIKLKKGTVSYGTFQEVTNKVNNDIKLIFNEISQNKDKYSSDSDELKVLNLHDQYFNLEKRNELGIKPIKKYLDMVDEIKDINDVHKILSEKNFMYFQSLINLGVGADCKESEKNILYVGNNRLALGNSYYYKNDDIKDVYLKYLFRINELSGLDKETSEANAKAFYEFEKILAQSIPTKEEETKEEDRIEKQYNIYTLKSLDSNFRNINLPMILKSFKLNRAEKIIVENPENLKVINTLLVPDNIKNIKIFLRTGIILKADSSLTTEFRNASSELKNKLYGAETYEMNESNSVKFVTCCLDEIVSKLYVNKCFDNNSKENVKNIIKEIIENFKNRLNNNTWLSNETKKKAIKKLETLDVKVGYPEKWNDYSGLVIKSYEDGGDLIDSLNSIYKFNVENEYKNLNKKNNKKEWSMAPCTVNAYYNPLNNEIVFPAAILQYPFYDIHNSKEENLGAIGIIIGHEITHAFDNTGCKFDENGDFKNWWIENDYKEFEKRKKNIANYYSQIVVGNHQCMNGELTVGENISDLGGMACALDIMKKIDNPDYKEFFESYARMWREVSTDEMKEFLLKNDCHAPKKIRVNEVLSQFEEFYKTYNITENDKMYVEKEKRIGIW